MAADGTIILARDVEYVCFNDRYVWVWSCIGSDTGLYDSKSAEPKVAKGFDDVYDRSGLRDKQGGCGGYHRAYVGPSLLFAGNKAPFLPSCQSRNIGDLSLRHREWFDRPCVDQNWPAPEN